MRVFLAAVLIGGIGPASVVAQQPEGKKNEGVPQPLPKINQRDRRIALITYNTVVFGIKLWEGENYEGCFRLYQGFLVGLLPSLEDRPKLTAKVLKYLHTADSLDAVKGALELRKALDTIQRETMSGPEVAARPLWDRLGGEKAVRAIVKDTIAGIRGDKELDLTRGGKILPLQDADVAAIEQGLVELISENAGGPLTYKGPRLSQLIIGTNITEQEYTLLNVHLFKAINKNNIPKPEAVELLGILGKFKSTLVNK